MVAVELTSEANRAANRYFERRGVIKKHSVGKVLEFWAGAPLNFQRAMAGDVIQELKETTIKEATSYVMRIFEMNHAATVDQAPEGKQEHKGSIRKPVSLASRDEQGTVHDSKTPRRAIDLE